MFALVITEKGGSQKRLEFDKPEVTIGRVQGNDIVLPKGNVSKRHSRIVLKDGRFIVVDLKSTNGTYVNGRKITSPLVVRSGDKVYIGDFIITVDEGAGGVSPTGPAPPPGPEDMLPSAPGSFSMATAPPSLVPTPGSMTAGPSVPVAPGPARVQESPSAPPPAFADPPPPRGSSISQGPTEGRASGAGPGLGAPAVSRSVPPPPRPVVPTQRGFDGAPPGPAPIAVPGPAPAPAPARAPLAPPGALPAAAQTRQMEDEGPTRLRDNDTHNRPKGGRTGLSASLRAVMSRVWQSVATDADRSRLEAAVNAAMEALGREGALDPSVNRDILSGAAVREALGLGALEALLGDPAVQEIIVERADRIVIDTGDGIELAHVVFSSEQAVRVAAARLLAQVSIALDPSRPVQHVRISEAWAVTIIHNAGSPQPILALQRLERRAPTFDSLVKDGLIPAAAATTLREAVQGRKTILVSGPEGSGVTTLITALLDITDSRERVGAITNPPGLVTDRDTVISLVRESGAATASLVREMARLRVARIAVDDVAGAEAYDVLVAVATRYPGALLGIHARSSRDALRLLETFVQLDARCTNPAAAAALLGESVQIVVQVSTGSDGRPRVTQVNDVQRTASGVSLTG